MPNMHVVIDLETLGLHSTAPILSIGVARVPDSADDQPQVIIDRAVHVQDSFDLGLLPDGSTVYWWLQQSDTARRAVAGPVGNLRKALRDLATALGEMDRHELFVWSHGAAFDIPILENAYRALRLEVPWHFRNVRDTRTIFDLAEQRGYFWNDDREVGEYRHVAIDDAMATAMRLRRAMDVVGWLTDDSGGWING